MTITRKIGEVFKITNPHYPYNVVTLKIVKQAGCRGCFFNGIDTYANTSIRCNKPIIDAGFCSKDCRSDNTPIKYVQVAGEVSTPVQPKCTFCDNLVALNYSLDKDASAIIPVQGSILRIYKEFKFKYCPVCGKELK